MNPYDFIITKEPVINVDFGATSSNIKLIK